MSPTRTDQREFARIDTELRVLVQPLDDARARALAERLTERSSVWTPSGESALRDLATGGSGTESVLAQTVLELSSQIVRLRARLERGTGPVLDATVVQLSGGGGRLVGKLPLASGDLFEILFVDDVEEVPPVRAVARVVHHAAEGHGFRYETIHPRDRELLIRFLYALQRRALRAATRD